LNAVPEQAKLSKLDELIRRLGEIRRALAESETAFESRIARVHPTYLKSARNLAHYIGLRHHDIRPLQEKLAQLGLSSLGRAEAHVMATLDAVLTAVHGLAGRTWQHLPRALDFVEGNRLLREHTETLLGPSPANRAVRIMVTMPSEAASDYHLVRELVARGMDCMRINCSYDGRSAWVAMAEHLKRAKRELGKNCRLSMDLAGPKLRVGPMEAGPEVIKVRPERDVTGTVLKPARIWLVPQAHTGAIVGGAESTPIPVAAGDLASLRTGDQIEFTDARGSSRRMVLAAMRRPAAGVMIARGELAGECGYERMAEIQEEILWVCEAAAHGAAPERDGHDHRQQLGRQSHSQRQGEHQGFKPAAVKPKALGQHEQHHQRDDPQNQFAEPAQPDFKRRRRRFCDQCVGEHTQRRLPACRADQQGRGAADHRGAGQSYSLGCDDGRSGPGLVDEVLFHRIGFARKQRLIDEKVARS